MKFTFVLVLIVGLLGAIEISKYNDVGKTPKEIVE